MNRFRIDRGAQHVIGLEKPKKGAKKDFDPREFRRFSVNIPTPDDWCPTLEDGTVEVQVLRLHSYTPKDRPAIRTCVWGGDDMGMERDEYFADWDKADEAYLRRVREVSGWGIVTFRMLTELGFNMA